MLGKWGALGVSQQEAETMGGLDLRTLHSHLSGNEQGISVLRFTQLHSLAMPGVQSINSQPTHKYWGFSVTLTPTFVAESYGI